MKGLLAIEWLKIKRYRTFWVLVGLFTLLLPIWNYEIASGFMQIGGNGKSGINFLDTAYSFPGVWGNIGFWGSIFVLFLSILVIIITTNEYTYRTHRQNVLDGWQRMQFYNAKVLVVLMLASAAALYLFILGIVLVFLLLISLLFALVLPPLSFTLMLAYINVCFSSDGCD